MDEQRKAQANEFGTLLRRLRRAAGYTSAAALAEKLLGAGFKFSDKNITAWERGEYPPRNQLVVQYLDGLLEAGGSLVEVLGLRGEESTADRLTALEERFDRLEALVEQAVLRRGKAR